MVYTQGMGTLIASGIVQDTKENMYCMLHNTGMTYLKGLGVGEDREVMSQMQTVVTDKWILCPVCRAKRWLCFFTTKVVIFISDTFCVIC